jgi:hypothetical protein
VRPWRRMISAIFARSGGPPAAALITSAASRKYCGALWFRRGMEIGARTHWSALLARGTLLGFGCQRGPRRGERARRSLPLLAGSRAPFVDGRLRMSGFTVEGLAWLGRREELAALQPNAEHVVAAGPLCVYGQLLFRTSAGIAAACACNTKRLHCQLATSPAFEKGLLSRRLILSKVHLVL